MLNHLRGLIHHVLDVFTVHVAHRTVVGFAVLLRHTERAQIFVGLICLLHGSTPTSAAKVPTALDASRVTEKLLPRDIACWTYSADQTDFDSVGEVHIDLRIPLCVLTSPAAVALDVIIHRGVVHRVLFYAAVLLHTKIRRKLMRKKKKIERSQLNIARTMSTCSKYLFCRRSTISD